MAGEPGTTGAGGDTADTEDEVIGADVEAGSAAGNNEGRGADDETVTEGRPSSNTRGRGGVIASDRARLSSSIIDFASSRLRSTSPLYAYAHSN